MSDATVKVRYNGKAGAEVKNRFGVWSIHAKNTGKGEPQEWMSPVKMLTERQAATLPPDLFEIEAPKKTAKPSTRRGAVAED